MKTYQNPELNVIFCEDCDVITLSIVDNENTPGRPGISVDDGTII